MPTQQWEATRRKPLNAMWLINMYNYFTTKKCEDIIKKG